MQKSADIKIYQSMNLTLPYQPKLAPNYNSVYLQSERLEGVGT